MAAFLCAPCKISPNVESLCSNSRVLLSCSIRSPDASSSFVNVTAFPLSYSSSRVLITRMSAGSCSLSSGYSVAPTSIISFIDSNALLCNSTVSLKALWRPFTSLPMFFAGMVATMFPRSVANSPSSVSAIMFLSRKYLPYFCLPFGVNNLKSPASWYTLMMLKFPEVCMLLPPVKLLMYGNAFNIGMVTRMAPCSRVPSAVKPAGMSMPFLLPPSFVVKSIRRPFLNSSFANACRMFPVTIYCKWRVWAACSLTNSSHCFNMFSFSSSVISHFVFCKIVLSFSSLLIGSSIFWSLLAKAKTARMALGAKGFLALRFNL